MNKLTRHLGAVVLLAAATGVATPATSFAASTSPKACKGTEVVERVHTYHRRYAPGAPVVIRLSAKNASGHDCALPSLANMGVRSAAGATVWRSAIMVDWIRGAVWKSGQVIKQNFTWDQHICTKTDCSGSASPGAYVATGQWGSYTPGKAHFVVNGIK